MISLINILKDIILEAKREKVYPTSKHRGSQEGPIRSDVKTAIKNSIENRWLLNIYYIGDKENAPGYRWVEPYVWGNYKGTGNEVLRAWQYKGTSAASSKYSATHPAGWRTFRLDRIKRTAPLTTKTFDKPRPLYHPDDKKMSGIKMRVSFDDDKEQDKNEK